MNKKSANIITVILLVITFIGIMVSYKNLPQIIPTHWGIDGEIDNTGSKSTLWLLYGIMIAINILFIVIANIDPKKQNYRIFKKSYDIFRVVFNLFFMAVIALIIMASTGNTTFNITRSIMFLTGILFAIIGNYLPKFKPNYTTGIKTPWTLDNENVWRKTHRFAGPLWVVGGITIAILSLLVSIKVLVILLLIIVGIITLIPVIYSYIVFKKEQQS